MTSEARIWLTPEEVARRVRVPVGTLANWRTRKQGPAYAKLSGAVRYDLDAVIAWENANTVQTDTDTSG